MLQYYDTYTKILTTPYTYNQELIDILTDTLQIIFQDLYNNKYSKFNQKIKENVLPLSLTQLVFGFSFNQEIKEHQLPNNFTLLHLDNKFNKNIKIPLSVKLLSCDVGRAILNNIPEFIQNIGIFYDDAENIPITNIPITVKKIYFIGPDKYIHLIEKIPFDCVVININKKIIYYSEIINFYTNSLIY
jgi:hypothetical protein